jgi:hypothetical protein
MKTVGIASIASLLLLSSIAPASAMSAPTVSSSTSQPAMAPIVPAPMDYTIDDADVPADTKIKRDSAIELAKQYVTIPSSHKLLDVSYQAGGYEAAGIRGYWSITFTKENQQDFYADINVIIDADSGNLSSYYITGTDPNKQNTFPPKVSLERAKQIANDYISLVSPDEKAQLQYDEEYEKLFLRPLVGEVEYPLNYSRVVNGIVVPSNYITLSVNGDGQIRSYTKQWNANLDFKAPVKPLSLDQAAVQFNKLSEVHLQYIIPAIPNGKATPAITYLMEPIMLDAETGEALSMTGTKRIIQPKPVPVSDKPLVGTSSSLNLTKEQAASRVSTLIPLPANAKFENASYYEDTDPATGVASFEWGLEWSLSLDKQDGSSIYAAVDSNTGAILQYYKYDYSAIEPAATKPTPAALSNEQLKAKAIEAVRKLLPSYAHELFLQPQYVGMAADGMASLSNSDFYFTRILNGVYTQTDSVTLHLNQVTGELEEFSSNLINHVYPAAAPEVISVEKAKKILLSQYQIEQQYMVVDHWDGDAYVQTPIPVFAVNTETPGAIVEPKLQQPETKLVYQLKSIYEFHDPAYLDATTGVWKSNETNQAVHMQNFNPVDLKGHPAEEALRLMLDYGALDVVEGKINPDALITRGEFVKMLVIALNGGYFPLAVDFAERPASFSDVGKDSPYFPYAETAIDYHLIDRATGLFQPSAALNRSEVADLIVRALGYRKLSEVEGLFSQKANDTDNLPNQGAIAIVSSLQIMTLEGETFSPYEQVTRAQAAIAFYNYLKTVSQLKDTSIAKG